MRKQRLSASLLLFFAVFSPLSAQTDSLPPLGGVVLDDSTYAAAGDPGGGYRALSPGKKKSLLEKAGIMPFNQCSEPACASCTVAAAVMARQKIYCDAQCRCTQQAVAFSWSYLHNQLVSLYGMDNIRLKNVLDMLQSQGIPSVEKFPNTPCSHQLQPTTQDRANAAPYQYLRYQPVFRAKTYLNGSPSERETRFREQLVPRTIAWIDDDIPVVVGLLVTENFRHLTEKDCFWELPVSLDDAKGHALLVMGYDNDKEEFTLLNSYGTGWGCNGVARISYADYTKVVKEGYVVTFDFDTGKSVVCPKRQ